MVNAINMALTPKIKPKTDLAALLKQYEELSGKKAKEPKLSVLQRAGKILTAFNTADPLYKKMYENKSFLKEYGKDIFSNLKAGITGREDKTAPIQKTYKDILVKKGMTDRPGKLDTVDILGLGGDVLFDPSTYLGGFAGKGILKAGGAAVKVAEKAPILGKAMAATKNLFTPEITKMTQGLEAAGLNSQRIYSKIIQAEKGTLNDTMDAVNGLYKQQKLVEKSIGKDRLKEITFLKETGVKTSNELLDNEVVFFNKAFKAIEDSEFKAGILKSKVDGYVRRVATPEYLEKIGSTDNFFAGIPKPLRQKLDFAKARTVDFKTIDEANKWSMGKYGVKMFEDNPYKALAKRTIEHKKAMAIDDLQKFTIKNYGVSEKALADMQKAGDPLASLYVKSTNPAFKGVNIPKPIQQFYDRANTILTNNKEINEFVKLYDKAMNFWKGSVYGWYPASHLTNAIGGYFHDFVAGALNPRLMAETEAVIKGTGTKIGKFSAKDIQGLAKQYGVMGESGFLDVPKALKIGGQEQGKIASTAGKIGQLPREAMGIIENRVRLPMFIDGLKKGMTPSDAAKRVIKFHFDYTPLGLSEFEKTIMKRIIPFYTFSRNIVPLTMEQALLKPYKYALPFKAMRSTGESITPEEQANLPQYLKEKLIQKTGEGKYRAGFNLPFEQAAQIVSNPLKFAWTASSPALKIPGELITGKNVFKGKDIKEDTSGWSYRNAPNFIKKFMEFNESKGKDGTSYYTVNPMKKYAVENFPFLSRIINVLQRQSTGETSAGLVPFKEYNSLPEANKNKVEKEMIKELEAIIQRQGKGYNYEQFIIKK